MELDDLKAEWARQSSAASGALVLNNAMMLQSLADGRAMRVRDAGAMSGLGFYAWIFFLAAFGLFIAAHSREVKFLAPAIALLAWTIVMGVVTLRQREALRALDFSRPPAALQPAIAKLRLARAETVKWAFLTGQIVWWVPFAIVAFQGLFGVDLYAVSGAMPAILLWNVVSGVVFVPVALVLGRALRPLLAGTDMAGSFLNAITGRDMQEAHAALARLRRFQAGAD